MVEKRWSRKLDGEALNFGRSGGGKWVTDFGHPVPCRWREASPRCRLVRELVTSERRGRRFAREVSLLAGRSWDFTTVRSRLSGGGTMKAVMISVVGLPFALAVALALLSSAVWAQQGYPVRDDCDAIVRELRMRLRGRITGKLRLGKLYWALRE
jgi:hypothetical protein